VPDIDVKRLTDCEISTDGESISLRMADQRGYASTVRLSIENAGALTMTLPRLIEQALQAKFRDHSLRYAFPLESWTLERATDATSGMVTLRTSAGFSVCFTMQLRQQDELGEALVSTSAIKTTVLSN
jgi:hypothetical protein